MGRVSYILAVRERRMDGVYDMGGGLESPSATSEAGAFSEGRISQDDALIEEIVSDPASQHQQPVPEAD